MQSKVSIVMPCYNKEDYIREMFDSIIAQNWDNIELILVNDGSTDGTREIITEYKIKLQKRGFKVVIIDQENAGVCAAAKAGLERITGDYVCMVDADDELSPVYVSTMAGWLEYDADCDYCVCGGIEYTGAGDEKVFLSDWSRGLHSDTGYLIERYLMHTMRSTVWIYMLRIDYLRKCNIVDTYFTETQGSHEPGYIIPILTMGGKYKYLPLPLYHFNSNGEGHSRSKEFEQMQRFYDEYCSLCKRTIERLPDSVVDKERKKGLIGISLISSYVFKYRFAVELHDGKEYIPGVLSELITCINSFFHLEQPITSEQISDVEGAFIQIATDILTGREKIWHRIKPPTGRIIGYGALGKVASRLIPALKDTSLEPTALWDINGDGFTVKKPDFNSLTKKDTIIIFPKMIDLNEILSSIKYSGCTIIGFEDITELLSSLRFSQILMMNYGVGGVSCNQKLAWWFHATTKKNG